MKKLLYIKDTTLDGCWLASSLADILIDLDDIGKKYKWSIKYIWATGDLGPNFSWDKIEDMAKNSPNGYCLTWPELKILSTKFTDVIDIVLIGSESDNFNTPSREGYEFLNKFPLSIAMEDKDFWEICTSDEEIIACLLKKYHDVEVIDVDSLKDKDSKK